MYAWIILFLVTFQLYAAAPLIEESSKSPASMELRGTGTKLQNGKIGTDVTIKTGRTDSTGENAVKEISYKDDANANSGFASDQPKKKKKTKRRSRVLMDGDSGTIVKINCEPATKDELLELLGPAFNARYMSVDKPTKDTGPVMGNEDALSLMGDDPKSTVAMDSHQKNNSHGSLAVDADFRRDLPNEPSLSTTKIRRGLARGKTVTVERFLRRIKRAPGKQKGGGSANKPHYAWECESRIKWHDLGGDTFPRFLRGVECTQPTCWYGHFSCRPRAFTVKVLRRKSDECIRVKVGKRGRPDKYEQEWIFEERAVTFCCDCVGY